MIRRIAHTIKRSWHQEKKIDLFCFLCANGFFTGPRRARTPLVFRMFYWLRILHFPFCLVLLVYTDLVSRVPCRGLLDLKRRNLEFRQGIVLFLENYLSLTTDQRLAMLESYPFYHQELMDQFVWKTDEVKALLLEISSVLGIPPSEEFFGSQV